jgi:hypothetical protein
MKFSQLLTEAIQRSEIPLRFEPGAEEAVAKPVTELLRYWVQAHEPEDANSDFAHGQKALIGQLVAELDDAREV